MTRQNGSRHSRTPARRSLREIIEIDAGAPSTVRRLVRWVTAGTPVCDDALLLSSEITTNAILHGVWKPGDHLELSIERHPGRVVISVIGPGFPKPLRSPDAEGPGGFGLELVASISDDWDMEAFGDQMTCVWFELSW